MSSEQTGTIKNSNEPAHEAYAEPVCGACRKSQKELDQLLRRCAKCRSQFYCTRECQKSDWKNHKKLCGNTRNDSAASMPNTANPSARKPGAICYIPKPFTALNNGTWLYNRPKKDVFKLLVDTYRMRIEDEYVFEGEVTEGSLYSGASAASALREFKSFLNNALRLDAKRENKLFPEWWSKNSFEECLKFASTDKFSNVGFATEKRDIQEHYKQENMPMQLRIFSEKIDGTLAAGMSGETMLQMQVECEKKSMNVHHF